MEPTILIDLIIIILAGTALGCIARMLRQPLIVSYLIAGLVIGPFGLNLILNRADIPLFAELGVALMLFAVGIETDIARLLKMKGIVVLGTLLQVFLTAGIVFAIMNYSGLALMESVYLGFILAFSSTVLVVKILTQENQLSTLHGRLIVGFALMQDVIAVLMLPLLANPAMIAHAGALANFALSIFSLFALAYLLNRLVLPRVLGYFSGQPELFYLLIISECFMFIGLSVLFDFSIAVGAFIGGLSLSSLPYNIEAVSKIRGVRDFFSTIFFVSIGMQVSLAFGAFPIALFLLMLGAVYILNPLVFYLIGIAGGYGGRTAFIVGLALAEASEFSFVLASQGLRLGQISQPVYGTALLVIAISLLTTPYLMQNSDAIYNRLEKIADALFPPHKRAFLGRKMRHLENLPEKKAMHRHSILVGAGIFGGSLLELLKSKGTLIVVDHNPHVVTELIKKGYNAIYGGPENEDVWDKVALEEARLLIITIPVVDKAAKLVKKARKLNPKMTVFGRAHYYGGALRLYESGADFVCMPHVIGANYFTRCVAEFLETGKLEEVTHLHEEYMGFLKEKAAEEKKYFGG
ncbi:MAG: cation:proton antiporter [Candidatus Diapherotrites archaeon]|nr:cation:proton antiporter [Candidatus Diapherotrites archaeon]